MNQNTGPTFVQLHRGPRILISATLADVANSMWPMATQPSPGVVPQHEAQKLSTAPRRASRRQRGVRGLGVAGVTYRNKKTGEVRKLGWHDPLRVLWENNEETYAVVSSDLHPFAVQGAEDNQETESLVEHNVHVFGEGRRVEFNPEPERRETKHGAIEIPQIRRPQ